MTRVGVRASFIIWLFASAAPVLRQPAAPPPPEEETANGGQPPPDAATAPTVQGGRTYTPEDFARFAPRNALDMLSQVPGFAIVSANTDRRGLGQATGNVLINGERST